MKLLRDTYIGTLNNRGEPTLQGTFEVAGSRNGIWLVKVVLQASPDGPEITEIQIKAKESSTPGSIDANLLRAFSLPRMRNALLDEQRRASGREPEFTRALMARLGKDSESTDGSNEPVGNWILARMGSRRPGRKGVPDLYYAQVAKRYVELIGTDSPIKVLAKEIDRTPKATQSLIHRCRERGFLTQGTSRRTGSGELTAKAKEVLRNESR